jgi:hypothetical protein
MIIYDNRFPPAGVPVMVWQLAHRAANTALNQPSTVP